jgi:hypothetical protein
MVTLGTQDTRRRQTIQRNWQHWVHKTQDEDKQSRETGNIGYTKHKTKTIQRNWQHWVHKTQDEHKQSRETGNIGYTKHKTKTIQRNWQHWVHKTQDEDNPEKLATLGTQNTRQNKKNTTRYVLDTTMPNKHKQRK